MKVYSQNIGRILAKINSKERIFNLSNFSHLVHQYIGRNNKMQRIFKHQFLKKKMYVWFGSNLRIKFSMLSSLQYLNLKQSNFILPLQPP